MRKMINNVLMSKKTTYILLSIIFINIFLSFCSAKFRDLSKPDLKMLSQVPTAVVSQVPITPDTNSMGLSIPIGIKISGVYSSDIRGYPRDRQPDAGCFEFNYETVNEDIEKKIIPYISVSDPSKNFPGDFNWDGVVDYTDYMILKSWWIAAYPDINESTIIPYPSEQNIPPIIVE